jgi:hypothetical protein
MLAILLLVVFSASPFGPGGPGNSGRRHKASCTDAPIAYRSHGIEATKELKQAPQEPHDLDDGEHKPEQFEHQSLDCRKNVVDLVYGLNQTTKARHGASMASQGTA